MRPVFSLLFLLVAAVISGEASTRPVSSPDDAAMIRIAVADALRSGEFDRADKLLHDPKIANSNNWKDQVWRGEALNILGRHAWREGRIAEAEVRLGDAEAAFRRAIELNDQAAEAYVSLVEFFSALGQKKFNNKAREVLARARAHLPPNESHWALAKMYDALKEKDNARKEYEVALAAAPDDSTSIRNLADFHLRNQGVAAATPLLTKILELKGKAKPQDVIWARRQLALLTASQGGYPNLLKARMMIEENLASGELAAEDLRAKATFLALDPRRAKRMEATEALETLLRHPDLGTLEDRYTLAQVYLALGNMRKFRKHMRPLLAKDPPDLRFIRTYIAAELESNELAEVEIWLSTLERVAPDWIDTVRFRADDLVRRDRPDEALALLRRFAERPDASPARLLEDQHSLVEIFEQLANRLSESQKPERTATGKRFSEGSGTVVPPLCRAASRGGDAPGRLLGPPRPRGRGAQVDGGTMVPLQGGGGGEGRRRPRRQKQARRRPECASREDPPGGLEGIPSCLALGVGLCRLRRLAEELRRGGELLPRGHRQGAQQRRGLEQPGHAVRRAGHQAGRGVGNGQRRDRVLARHVQARHPRYGPPGEE